LQPILAISSAKYQVMELNGTRHLGILKQLLDYQNYFLLGDIRKSKS
jgi:hypothetical protein